MAKGKKKGATPAAPPSPVKVQSAAPPRQVGMLPLVHYQARVPIQLGAIYLVIARGGTMLQEGKRAVPAEALDALIRHPVPTLAVVIGGVAIVQLWFGFWLARIRQTAVDRPGTSGAERQQVPDKGFVETLKDIGSQAMKGRRPRRNVPTPTATGPEFSISSLLSAFAVTLLASITIHVGAILLGAPFFSKASETYFLSLLVAVLAILPVALTVSHTEKYTWLRLFSSLSPSNDLEFALLLPALGTLGGCWLGAVPIPLDWDRPWQAWPTTCVVGAFLGHAIGSLAALVWCSTYTNTPHPVKID